MSHHWVFLALCISHLFLDDNLDSSNAGDATWLEFALQMAVHFSDMPK